MQSELRPSTYQFRREHLQQDVLAIMGRLWGIYKPLTHNPSPNPVSLTRDDLQTLTQQEYVVAKKTDGVRYNLVMGKHSKGGRPFAAMVDRALNVFQVELFAPRHYFNGSLFDGELVWNKNHHCLNYLVWDVVSVDGNSIGKRDLMARYEMINQAFPQESEWDKTMLTDKPLEQAKKFAQSDKIVAVPNEHTPLFLYSKPCVKVDSLSSLHRTATSHDTDGYVFTPIAAPVFKNRHTSMFKWKFEPTIDVRYVPGYRLFCMHGKHEVDVTVALSRWVVTIDKRDVSSLPSDPDTSMILELSLKVDENRVICRLHRFRQDKLTPNDYRTIEGVFNEIKESVQLNTLLHLHDKSI